ncbi:MAG: hypothetical protein AB1486_34990 [Planctomycetota bacterium]
MSSLPALVREGKVDRAEQHACALMLETCLRRHAAAWGGLCRLGAATSSDGRTDSVQWRALVAPEERDLIDDIATAFASVFTVEERAELRVRHS